MSWADKIVPAMVNLRVDRNKNILSSWHLGVFVPIFWLPSAFFEVFAIGLWNVGYGLCQIVVSLAALLFLELPVLLFFGLFGMVRRATSKEVARAKIEDEQGDDED